MKITTTLLLALMLLSTSVRAQDNVVWAIQDEWPPYVIDSQDVKGLAFDIISASFAAQGFKLKHTIKPWSRALREVATQRYDIALTVWKSSERLEYLDFSEPYLINSLVFVSLADQSFEYNDINSLAGKRIGVLRDYAYDDDFMNANQFDRLDADDLSTNIKKLKTGRIDALVVDEIFFRWFIKRSDFDIKEFAVIEKPLAENPLHIAISRDHPKKERLMAAFNAGLKSLQQSGQITSLMNKYE